ncbi:ATP-binding protein [Rhizobium sp.]|uniref:hybrid sensor histidine kinase/response regulator n=1 Tax=Rhizobium sp. TaxID=391 RepID=UPI0028AF99BC
MCQNIAEVADRIEDRIGAVLLTEEALANGAETLKTALGSQPSWSDIPFVLLAAQRTGRTPNAKLSQLALFDLASNSVVLERPLGRASLFSAVASAMRLRQKQFQMRDRLAELDESEAQLRLATTAGGIGIWDFDPQTGRLQWDERCKIMFGLKPDAEITYEDSFLAGLHPDDRDRCDMAVRQAIDPSGDGQVNIEYRTIGIEDGLERWIIAKGGTIFSDSLPTRFIGTVVDITQRKATERALAQSEAALRSEQQALDALNRTLEERVIERTSELEQEMAARGRAEEALRQAQKMEAIGQLTGGIAHDFNNMLTGIIGGVNLAKRRIAMGKMEDVDRFMDAATESAHRAAALISRLLAFSRRQTLDAKPLDIVAQLHSTKELLERTLPETIIIDISVNAEIGRVIADANQLESALLNLAVNARDAMPDGGRLTIKASREAVSAGNRHDLSAGDYVLIKVIDNGVGMPPDLVDKVFEPFFTTKPIGQGTGLGLSMIYGFAQQSGGSVAIASEPGVGTEITLYLPAAGEGSNTIEKKAATPIVEGQGQTVLVVEDDDAVRLLICEVLSELSYKTIQADDSIPAITQLTRDQTIDLMVSDVGLPSMNGRQLAEVARQQRPGLPILFVTGYAENAATKAGFLGTNMDMIAKPFAVETLSAKISELMAKQIVSPP